MLLTKRLHCASFLRGCHHSQRLDRSPGGIRLERYTSNDGKFVASGSRDKTAHAWNVATGEVVAVLKEPTDRVIGVSFSADSRYLAAGVANHDGSIRVWDCETWQQVGYR